MRSPADHRRSVRRSHARALEGQEPRVRLPLTWLNQGPPSTGNTNESFPGGVPFPGGPTDLVSAQGVGQNFIEVIPSTKTVIVHMRPPQLLKAPEILRDGKRSSTARSS